MKKTILAVLMVLLILLTGFLGEFILNHRDDDLGMEPLNQIGREKNPAPVDPEGLKRLDLDPFVSSLPVVMVDSRNQQIIKEEMKTVSVAIYDDPRGENDILGDANEVLTAGLKLRGASSYNFDKNQYRLKFYRDRRDKALPYPFLGMAPDSEWVLHGPYLDQSLLRNYMMYTLSRVVMDWAPDCRFFELFVDGQYLGVYLAVEPVTPGPSRLGLSEFGLLSGATPYIIARDRLGTQYHPFEPYAIRNGLAGNEMGIRYPSRTHLTPIQKEWIEQDVSKFEKVLYSDHFADPDTGYARFIDVDAFVDYVVLNELCMNHDAGNLSTFMYKELDGKLKPAVWDFNNCFDNYQWFSIDYREFCTQENYWFDRLMMDRAFVDKVVSRYHELRKTTLSDEHLELILFGGKEKLGPAIERNFKRWGYTFENPMLSEEDGERDRHPNAYAEAFNRLMWTMHKRTEFMDQSIDELYQNCIN